jgi:SAM-dependent methyltransferase
MKSSGILNLIRNSFSKLKRINFLFSGSASYWERRYTKGGNSGSGSYGRLSLFKASVINEFVKENEIKTVIEFGCGDGHQLSLAQYPAYIGLDVSPTILQLCRQKFTNDSSKVFFVYNALIFKEHEFNADLGLSLDVIFHLIEDNVFHQYMTHLFTVSSRFVIIYSSNIEGKQNYHEKPRKFDEWIKTNRAEWKLIEKINNPYPYNPENSANTSQSDFYIYQRE